MDFTVLNLKHIFELLITLFYCLYGLWISLCDNLSTGCAKSYSQLILNLIIHKRFLLGKIKRNRHDRCG